MMKRQRMTNWIGMICAAVLLFGLAQTADAANTASGTLISNTAEISYAVGTETITIKSSPIGNSDPTSSGAPTEFRVDNKVDLMVTCNTPTVTVAPGASDQKLEFTITNNGNTTQGYSLAVLDDSTAIPMQNKRIEYDANNDGTIDGTYTLPALGTYSNLIDVSPGTSITVTLLMDAPGTSDALDTDTDTYHLVVTTLDQGTNNPTVATDDAVENTLLYNASGKVDVVFADLQGSHSSDVEYDGVYSASGMYQVAAAVLTVTKAVKVINDGIDINHVNPKAIPGATVEYTITVGNSGHAAATGVTVTDSIPANCTFLSIDASGLSIDTDSDGNVDGVTATFDVLGVDPTDPSTIPSKSLTFQVTID